jgi:hypothetical protein
MSSSATFRPDPFSQPFYPVGGADRPDPTAIRSRRRSVLLLACLIGLFVGVTILFLAPSLIATAKLSSALELYAKRQEVDAIVRLDEAIAWQPSNLSIRAQRCVLLSRHGEIEKAKLDLQMIEKELQADESKLSAAQLEMRAMLRQACGQHRIALEDMKRAQALLEVENSPSQRTAMQLNNVAYFAGLAVEYEPGDPKEDEKLLLQMLADCDKSVKLSGDEHTILDTRGYLHYLLGITSQAIADFDKAISKSDEELKEAQLQIKQNSRESYPMLYQLREREYSAAVMLQHRMKAYQKSGNPEAAKKDRASIVSLGFNPDLSLN